MTTINRRGSISRQFRHGNMMIILPGLMLTVTVTLAVRPDITGSLLDSTSIFPPSWEAVMLTFTMDEAMVMVEEGLVGYDMLCMVVPKK